LQLIHEIKKQTAVAFTFLCSCRLFSSLILSLPCQPFTSVWVHFSHRNLWWWETSHQVASVFFLK